jgi:hypothetical protein
MALFGENSENVAAYQNNRRKIVAAKKINGIGGKCGGIGVWHRQYSGVTEENRAASRRAARGVARQRRRHGIARTLLSAARAWRMLAAASARHMQRRGVGNRAGAASRAHNGISVVARHRIVSSAHAHQSRSARNARHADNNGAARIGTGAPRMHKTGAAAYRRGIARHRHGVNVCAFCWQRAPALAMAARGGMAATINKYQRLVRASRRRACGGMAA